MRQLEIYILYYPLKKNHYTFFIITVILLFRLENQVNYNYSFTLENVYRTYRGKDILRALTLSILHLHRKKHFGWDFCFCF